jgi:hypothetical protein
MTGAGDHSYKRNLIAFRHATENDGSDEIETPIGITREWNPSLPEVITPMNK